MFKLEVIGLLVISLTLVACQHSFGRKKTVNHKVDDIYGKLGNLIASKITNKLGEFMDMDTLDMVVDSLIETDEECNHNECDPGDYIKDLGVSFISKLITNFMNEEKQKNNFESSQNTLDASIEEECTAKECPAGKVLKTKTHHTPTSNGCGAFGLQWKRESLPDEGFEDCCNDHDYCYDDCGADREICDLKFKKCLHKICKTRENKWTVNEMKDCQKTATIMHMITQKFGCKAYQDAQENACVCVKGVNHQEL